MGRRQEKEWQLGQQVLPLPLISLRSCTEMGLGGRLGGEAKEKSGVGGACPQAQPGGKLLAPR